MKTLHALVASLAGCLLVTVAASAADNGRGWDRWEVGAGAEYFFGGKVTFNPQSYYRNNMPSLFEASGVYDPLDRIGPADAPFNREYGPGNYVRIGSRSGTHTENFGFDPANSGFHPNFPWYDANGATLLYGASGYQRDVSRSFNSSALGGGGKDDLSGFVPAISLGKNYNLNRHWFTGFGLGLTFMPLEGSVGGTSFSGRDTETLTERTTWDSYNSCCSGPVTQVGSFAGSLGGSAPFIIDNLPTTRTVELGGTTVNTADYYGSVSQEVDLNILTLYVGPRLGYKTNPDKHDRYWRFMVEGGPSFGFMWGDYTMHESLSVSRNGGGYGSAGTYSRTSSQDDFIFGAYVKGAVGWIGKKWALQAYGKYDWRDTKQVGGASVDLSGPSAGIEAIFRF